MNLLQSFSDLKSDMRNQLSRKISCFILPIYIVICIHIIYYLYIISKIFLLDIFRYLCQHLTSGYLLISWYHPTEQGKCYCHLIQDGSIWRIMRRHFEISSDIKRKYTCMRLTVTFQLVCNSDWYIIQLETSRLVF